MTIETWRYNQPGERIELPVTSDDPWLLLARAQMPGTHAVLMRRSAIIEVGGWKPDQPCCQEHELFLRLLMGGKKFAYVPEIGAIYRQWSENTVSNKDPSQTVIRRLAIVDAAEQYLRDTDAIKPVHSDAFASQRIELARTLYRFNRSAAMERVAKAARIRPSFKLTEDTPSFPRLYRVVFNNVGFRAAEYIAEMTRSWRRRTQLDIVP